MIVYVSDLQQNVNCLIHDSLIGALLVPATQPHSE